MYRNVASDRETWKFYRSTVPPFQCFHVISLSFLTHMITIYIYIYKEKALIGYFCFFNKKILEIEGQHNHPNKEELSNYKRLASLDIHRKLVKLPIMVKPYNASLFQMNKYK